ncbi:MAG: DNA ligase [Psychromonas sp.]|nr:DNA ligase [Alteromonadales bacterium]MCP5077681.1 DNA ligase [Psychromonas sp.]
MPALLLFVLLFPCSLFASSPPIQLATKFHEDINIHDYWISEKLDGVRGYWNGKQLLSRQGNPFSAPKWFTDEFPNIALDGELWISRGKFEQVSAIVRTEKGKENDWKQISFMIFDLPSSDANFSIRLKEMHHLVENSNSPYLKIIHQYKLMSHKQLQKKLLEVVEANGEGLMLHHIDAYYQVKRNQDLMKLKRFDDAEAVVLQHIEGKGKHKGRMGALVVKTSEGITFKIGTGFSDKQREQPPQIGDTITYRYTGKTNNGVPRFASFIRIRFVASP